MSSEQRGLTDDEPQIGFFVISSNCSRSAGSRKIHIPAAGGTSPICEGETRDDGGWKSKRIETRPPSWRKDKWCEKCRERWRDVNACIQSPELDSRKVASTRVSDELRKRVDAYAERMGLTRGEIVRKGLKYMLMPAEERGWTDEELLDALRNFEEEFGRPPTGDDLDSVDGYPSAPAYQNAFGGIPAAREKADVGHPDNSKATTQDAIRAYEYLRSNPSAPIDEVMSETGVTQYVARSVATHVSRMWDND